MQDHAVAQPDSAMVPASRFPGLPFENIRITFEHGKSTSNEKKPACHESGITSVSVPLG
jgi:hypothetical protein